MNGKVLTTIVDFHNPDTCSIKVIGTVQPPFAVPLGGRQSFAVNRKARFKM